MGRAKSAHGHVTDVPLVLPHPLRRVVRAPYSLLHPNLRREMASNTALSAPIEGSCSGRGLPSEPKVAEMLVRPEKWSIPVSSASPPLSSVFLGKRPKL